MFIFLEGFQDFRELDERSLGGYRQVVVDVNKSTKEKVIEKELEKGCQMMNLAIFRVT